MPLCPMAMEAQSSFVRHVASHVLVRYCTTCEILVFVASVLGELQ